MSPEQQSPKTESSASESKSMKAEASESESESKSESSIWNFSVTVLLSKPIEVTNSQKKLYFFIIFTDVRRIPCHRGATGCWMMKLDQTWPKAGWFDSFCLRPTGCTCSLCTPGYAGDIGHICRTRPESSSHYGSRPSPRSSHCLPSPRPRPGKVGLKTGLETFNTGNNMKGMKNTVWVRLHNLPPPRPQTGLWTPVHRTVFMDTL